jgi:hypothetical protein
LATFWNNPSEVPGVSRIHGLKESEGMSQGLVE